MGGGAVAIALSEVLDDADAEEGLEVANLRTFAFRMASVTTSPIS